MGTDSEIDGSVGAGWAFDASTVTSLGVATLVAPHTSAACCEECRNNYGLAAEMFDFNSATKSLTHPDAGRVQVELRTGGIHLRRGPEGDLLLLHQRQTHALYAGRPQGVQIQVRGGQEQDMRRDESYEPLQNGSAELPVVRLL